MLLRNKAGIVAFYHTAEAAVPPGILTNFITPEISYAQRLYHAFPANQHHFCEYRYLAKLASAMTESSLSPTADWYRACRLSLSATASSSES